MNFKRIAVIAALATSSLTLAADAPELWRKHCKSCHGEDGKAKTKTGLGETLKAAEKAWLKIPWTALEAKKLKATTLK